ncbi:MAG: hypothetical protein QNJ62_00615 [Methyloceanibacter sp.]|nr:hypothetical protein [Methyloceanibacter sp.]
MVAPNPNVISVQIVFGLPDNATSLAEYVDTWIARYKSGSLLDRLYNYWILGKGADEKKLRWSAVRNVFGWGRD